MTGAVLMLAAVVDTGEVSVVANEGLLDSSFNLCSWRESQQFIHMLNGHQHQCSSQSKTNKQKKTCGIFNWTFFHGLRDTLIKSYGWNLFLRQIVKVKWLSFGSQNVLLINSLYLLFIIFITSFLPGLWWNLWYGTRQEYTVQCLGPQAIMVH